MCRGGEKEGAPPGTKFGGTLSRLDSNGRSRARCTLGLKYSLLIETQPLSLRLSNRLRELTTGKGELDESGERVEGRGAHFSRHIVYQCNW